MPPALKGSPGEVGVSAASRPITAQTHTCPAHGTLYFPPPLPQTPETRRVASPHMQHLSAEPVPFPAIVLLYLLCQLSPAQGQKKKLKFLRKWNFFFFFFCSALTSPKERVPPQNTLRFPIFAFRLLILCHCDGIPVKSIAPYKAPLFLTIQNIYPNLPLVIFCFVLFLNTKRHL